MSFANSDSLTSHFPVCVRFISYSCLIALNKSGEGSHSCLVSDLSENILSFFQFDILLDVNLSCKVLIVLRYISDIYQICWVIFIMEGCWILLKIFLLLFFLHSFYWCDIWHLLICLYRTIFGINPTWL